MRRWSMARIDRKNVICQITLLQSPCKHRNQRSWSKELWWTMHQRQPPNNPSDWSQWHSGWRRFLSRTSNGTRWSVCLEAATKTKASSRPMPISTKSNVCVTLLMGNPQRLQKRKGCRHAQNHGCAGPYTQGCAGIDPPLTIYVSSFPSLGHDHACASIHNHDQKGWHHKWSVVRDWSLKLVVQGCFVEEFQTVDRGLHDLVLPAFSTTLLSRSATMAPSALPEG